MLRYLLDSNLCIRLIRDRQPSLRARFDAEAAALCISTVVLFELEYAAANSGRIAEGQAQVAALARKLQVLEFDAAAARHAGEIKAALHARGQTIGSFDVMIAGHARSRGLIVVTGNPGGFNRVDGLRCEDWRDASPP